jgi:hypothetical protein
MHLQLRIEQDLNVIQQATACPFEGELLNGSWSIGYAALHQVLSEDLGKIDPSQPPGVT